jgi:hypothetical protein
VIIVFSHGVTGMTTGRIFRDFLLLIPVVIGGIVTGHELFKKFSNKLYNRIVLVMLFVIGAALIIFP